MRFITLFFLLLTTLTGCGKPCCFHESHEDAYLSGNTNSSFDYDTYRVIDQGKGSVNLEKSNVSGAVLTQKKLSAECSDLGDICVTGDTWLRDTIVRGESHIGKGARLLDTEIYGLFEVQGDLLATDTVFHDHVHVVDGFISATRTCFLENLCANSEIILLDSTHTQSIYLEPISPRYNSQIVCIRAGSIVEGDICFAKGCGRVLLDPTSTICGSIYGGHIIKPSEYHENCR
jgi:hypothetical protein